MFRQLKKLFTPRPAADTDDLLVNAYSTLATVPEPAFAHQLHARRDDTDAVERFADRANLVQLDEERVPNLLADSALEDFRIRHEHVVANQLHTIAKGAGQRLPAVPVAFGKAVFD